MPCSEVKLAELYNISSRNSMLIGIDHIAFLQEIIDFMSQPTLLMQLLQVHFMCSNA
jgi:hypothetical protein